MTERVLIHPVHSEVKARQGGFRFVHVVEHWSTGVLEYWKIECSSCGKTVEGGHDLFIHRHWRDQYVQQVPQPHPCQ